MAEAVQPARPLTDPRLQQLLAGLRAVRGGDFGTRLDKTGDPLGDEIATVFNEMVDQLALFTSEVTRVAREVGTEGRLGGQAQVPGVAGTWKDLTDSVNAMAANLTSQVRDIAQIATAVAGGDLSQKITVDVRGEMLELKLTINTMVDQLSSFADEVTRVAREVGTDGRLGGQADVEGVSGTWKDLTESVNSMAANLTDQVRSIAEVTTAVARGDLGRKIRVDARGEILELKETINTMVDQLSSFGDEVTRVAREVGTEGRLGGQADVKGVSGTWKDLTDNVNSMANNLTPQVRSIAEVTTAVARGDLSKQIDVDARGEILELKTTINTMVDQLSSFADEVNRVAREVGTEGRLGGQADVKGVSGTWKDLTDNVNSMANNLTGQVRNIAQVTTAVAQGDLSKKIDVDARGEILELKTTINTMVDQLSSFAGEVNRVAREVGRHGRLGGQAEVEGVSGIWKRLTEDVNELASNLTRQVRAIAEVTSAVATGDLTRSITVEAEGEVDALKDNINAMVQSLREKTKAYEQQVWLQTSLARIAGLMQGHRDLATVADLIMDELVPLVGAQHGTFFLADATDGELKLRLLAGYGLLADKDSSAQFRLGQSLIGHAAKTRKPILVKDAPADYVKISSGLGEAVPINLIVMPIVFEGQVLGVIEAASFSAFTQVHQDFLEQLMETIGVNVNALMANARTDALLEESRRLAAELQARQEELQQSNADLGDKAAQLARQNRDIEFKNVEIEQARQEIEERASQLALASRYKSQFLANVSHELRTPLNSLLILARLLAQNSTGNLSAKQVEYANVIYSSGSDLLQLINDILDLSKAEAGRMDVHPEHVTLADLADDLRSVFGPLAAEKNLEFGIEIAADIPQALFTDRHRLRQVLANLLSNSVKFTKVGRVGLVVQPAGPAAPGEEPEIAFAVTDTGIGISPENLSTIFGAFEQGDGTTSRSYGGTGLGLAICREVASHLGGRIRAESQPGVGSTFTLLLPASYRATQPGETPAPLLAGAGPAEAGLAEAGVSAEPPAAGEPPAGAALAGTPPGAPPAGAGTPARAGSAGFASDQPVPAGPSPVPGNGAGHPANGSRRDADGRGGRMVAASGPHHALHGRRVLIVDDDVRNVFAITSILELYGISVAHAADGRKGIGRLLASDDIDLVLMDVMMPEMDGYATMAAIRKMPRFADLPVIAVTARAMPEDRAKSLASGATDYITKPVDTEELLSCMERCLAGSAAGGPE
jgi:signal transduction histidine kinase/HAMP domain-containing protein/CheY-like chemotaxis protein